MFIKVYIYKRDELIFSRYKYIFIKEIFSTYDPPKTCIPSKANMRMNKKSKNNKLRIDFMLLSNEAIKFFSDPQYLRMKLLLSYY